MATGLWLAARLVAPTYGVAVGPPSVAVTLNWKYLELWGGGCSMRRVGPAEGRDFSAYSKPSRGAFASRGAAGLHHLPSSSHRRRSSATTWRFGESKELTKGGGKGGHCVGLRKYGHYGLFS